VAKYCNEHVCVFLCVSVCMCVCLSVREHISRTTCTIFTKFFMHVARRRGSVLLWHGDEIPRGKAILEVFYTIGNTLYSIAFGTQAEMTEPIEMPFGLMTWVGLRYHVLDGGPDSRMGRGNFENVAAHCNVMGTLLCAVQRRLNRSTFCFG